MDPASIRFFAWIINNPQLKFKSYQRAAISKWIPGIYDSVTKVENKKILDWYGQGWGRSKYESIIKAVAEILERELMARHKINISNGCAVHVDKAKACQNAAFELIERDAFFCHYLTETPFEAFKGQVNIFGLPLNQFLKKMLKMHLKIRIFKMRTAVPCAAIFVFVQTTKGTEKNGFQFGTACSAKYEEAIEHALIEALRSVAHSATNPKIEKITETNFLSPMWKDVPDIKKHSLIRRDSDYAKYFARTFLKPTIINKKIGRPILKLSSVKTKEFKNTFKDLKALPLYFVQARSPLLQPLYFGASTNENINLKRLQTFLNDPNFKIPNLRPHPFS